MALVSGAFKPGGASSTIAVTNSSQRVALSCAASNAYVSNVGTTECFIEFGSATVTATAGGSSTAASDGSMAIPGGFYGVVSTGGQSNMAAITASGTTTLRITPGEGE